MKKKNFNSKLSLGKKMISNLQENNVYGGADTVVSGTYIIVTTIRILTEHITDPRICIGDVTKTCVCPDPQPVDTTQVTTLPPSCVPDACTF